ncbi:MAG: hypothetical protein M0Z49_01850 [Chloroflexi bacterium]|nr:hypothetical protein [Chloroflexota bacterium]
MHLITTVYAPVLALSGLVLLLGVIAWARDARAGDPVVDHARRVSRVRQFAAAGRRAEVLAASGVVARVRRRPQRRIVGWVTVRASLRAIAHRVDGAVGSAAAGARAAGRRSQARMSQARSRGAASSYGRSPGTTWASGTAAVARGSRIAWRRLSDAAVRADAAAVAAQRKLVGSVEEWAASVRARARDGARTDGARTDGARRPAPRGIHLPTTAEIEAAIRDAEAAVRDRVVAPHVSETSNTRIAVDEAVVAGPRGTRAGTIPADVLSAEGDRPNSR